MPNKIITAPQYILLYTTESMEEVGKQFWYCQSIHDTEEQAIATLLALAESTYKHARIVKATLPVLTLPDDFETITGETTHGEQ